jgi:hypothetical protein
MYQKTEAKRYHKSDEEKSQKANGKFRVKTGPPKEI